MIIMIMIINSNTDSDNSHDIINDKHNNDNNHTNCYCCYYYAMCTHICISDDLGSPPEGQEFRDFNCLYDNITLRNNINIYI